MDLDERAFEVSQSAGRSVLGREITDRTSIERCCDVGSCLSLVSLLIYKLLNRNQSIMSEEDKRGRGQGRRGSLRPSIILLDNSFTGDKTGEGEQKLVGSNMV